MMNDHMLNYDYPPYRPPNEAYSALIRISRGCPWNKCLFCTLYKDMKFHKKQLEEVKKDIDKAVKIYPYAKTVFIADSDSLIMKNIKNMIQYVKHSFPNAERITSYARAKTLKNLGLNRLKELKETGLTRVHVGLESGDKKTLDFMQKGATPEEMIEGGKVAKDASLELSFYVLIGAGGKVRLKEHAIESARVCNMVNPDFIRLRTLIVQHGSLLEEKMKNGWYQPTLPLDKIIEVKTFLENLSVNNCEIASDHFTNYIWLASELVYQGINGVLPNDKQRMLSFLNDIIDLLKNSNEEIVDATILYDRGQINSL